MIVDSCVHRDVHNYPRSLSATAFQRNRTEPVITRRSAGWPSTHILKSESRDYPTSIYDEEFGARFARAAGLSPFPTWIEEFEGVPRPW